MTATVRTGRGNGCSMNEVVRDPTGLEVTLTEECWAGHITTRHPEMSAVRGLVLETIRKPDAIHLGKRDPSRRIYVKKYPYPGQVGNWLDLLVFVSHNGYVATTHFAAYSTRMLGTQIWPSK
jgi:hypothetical protein